MKHELHDVLGSGVVTRTPKIDQELQQNHNGTHNTIEHKKTRKSVGPLSKSGGRFFLQRSPREPGKHSQRLTAGSETDDPPNAAQGVVIICRRSLELGFYEVDMAMMNRCP